MSPERIVTGNGPADRLLEALREWNAPVEAQSKQEIAAAWVELKHRVRRALPEILAAERRRTIASARGRVGRLGEFMPHAVSRQDVLQLLDDMEAEATP